MSDSITCKVKVCAGSRLHFGLIDLSGKTKRIDGGLGLSLQNPSLIVTAEHTRNLEIYAPLNLEMLCHKVVSDLYPKLGTDNFRINIQTDIERHVGFGSGTQTSLAIGSAITALLYGQAMAPYELARLLARGGTSGIGVHAFAHGGMIVDGGRKWIAEKFKFGASSRFKFSTVPPMVSRLAFPHWGICILLPEDNHRIYGDIENSLFQELTPISVREVEKICRYILMELLPSVATEDYSTFCDVLVKMRTLGFKRREIETYSNAQKYISLLENAGFRGVSMSSWGPTIFGFAPSIEEASLLSLPLQNLPSIRKLVITQASNHPSKLEVSIN